ncbi:hypothetical protein ABZ923_11885 [Streptomyces sp. NPDC046881]|uniref:hypothetical protein n=1 Tax=Streptomyces sp. NPDC046881 TaxID=3155374 RepID=UPI0033CA5183
MPARAGPLRITGLYIPAEEEAELGGEPYAAARADHHSTRLLIGDVRGSGLAAINKDGRPPGIFPGAGVAWSDGVRVVRCGERPDHVPSEAARRQHAEPSRAL